MVFRVGDDIKMHGIGSYYLDIVKTITGSGRYAMSVIDSFYGVAAEYDPSITFCHGDGEKKLAVDSIIEMAAPMFDALTGPDYQLVYTKYNIHDMVEVYFELMLRETWATCNLQRMSKRRLVADISIGDEMDEEERAIYPTMLSFTITNSRVLTLIHPKYGPTAMVLTSKAPRTCQVADITAVDTMQIYTRDGVMEILSKHEMIAEMMDIIEMHRRANTKKPRETQQ